MDHLQPGQVRFTYLHGGEHFLDVQDPDDDGPTPAGWLAAAVPRDLQARIDAWDERMGTVFDTAHHGEGLPPEAWPAELHAAGLPVVRDAWWASDDA